MMMILMNLGVVIVLWLGGMQVQQGDMQVGQIVAFINYLQRALMSLLMVSMLILQISRAAASADRIQRVLDTEPVLHDRPDARASFMPQGRVAFESVTFGYNQHGADPVLKDINFVVEAGQTVAILGATGSGKSSLVHLIPRFYEATNGRVTIDGLDVRELPQDVLRRHIGMALQEAVLFSGSVRNNICYGRPDATDYEIMAAAKAAQAHDFIVQLPEGYNTKLGQRGVNLSGGQKQRIAIARALLVRPVILILDDSTSAVDSATEAEIQAALTESRKGRTWFIIAQRLSSVLKADKILVLDDGRIAAEGTHATLMAVSPIYRDIYDSQIGQGVTANA
jgi:ATP-binding cassette, subfamily B, multidrug efflux pump